MSSGLDMDARRVADTWRSGASGEWAAQSAWISGLASWRIGDFESASRDFQQVAALADQRELRAGAYYWAARAEQATGRAASVEPLLRQAALSPESFYGLLARETLGMDTKLPADPYAGRDPRIDQLPNVQRAIELAKIGEPSLAGEMLRHQAKIGSPAEHHALIELAKSLICRALRSGLQTTASPAPRPTPPTAIQTRLGVRSPAGESIRRSRSATSSRNPHSAPTRSARPALSD